MYYLRMNKEFKTRTFAETLLVLCRHWAPRTLRENGHLNQTAAAKFLHTNQPTVRRWLNGATPDHESVMLLSNRLNLTPSQIRGEMPIDGIDDNSENSKGILPELIVNITQRIPLISEVQAGAWMEAVDNYHVGDGEEWIVTTSNVGARAFALKVTGDSMCNPNGTPSIPEGSIVIIDPEATPTNGKIVVAKLPATNEAMLKKLIIDGPNKYLKPLNPEYRTIPINEDCLIIGVAKQILQDL